MIPKRPFINQEISYINIDGEIKLSTFSNNMKAFLSIIEIGNKKCHICYEINTPIKLVHDELIMSIDGLQSTIPPWKIDHPNYTSLTTTIKLNDIFKNYLKESLIEDVIFEIFLLDISETKKTTFTVERNFK